MKSLSDLIIENIPMQLKLDKWSRVLCKMCNDHGKKGSRAGFLISANGGVGYNCFNCGYSAAYDPDTNKRVPQKMVTLLKEFGIPEESITCIHNDSLIKSIGKPQKSYVPKQVTVPDCFYYLNNADEDDKIAIIAKDFLNNRDLDYMDYPYMLCGSTKDQQWKHWQKRLIIPSFRYDKVIQLQGRSLVPSVKPKFVSTSMENCLYGFDNLYKQYEQPLFICEGILDAMHLNGCAIYGNKIKEGQMHWLKQSPKNKVCVPDKGEESKVFCMQGLKEGWSVSIPDIGSCKDVCEAVEKYGKLYTLKAIYNGIVSGHEGEVRLKAY